MTQQDFVGSLGHRVPQGKYVSRDSQGPRVTEAYLAEMVLKDCLDHKVPQG